jgi:hypothetical protein
LREKHWSHRLLDTGDAIVEALGTVGISVCGAVRCC